MQLFHTFWPVQSSNFQKLKVYEQNYIFTTLFLPLLLSNLNATYLKLLQKWYKSS